MKILFVVVAFMPSLAFGGPEKAAYDLAKELVKRGHEVEVYTSDAKDPFSRLNVPQTDMVEGIKVHYFKNISLATIRAMKLFITPSLISTVKKNIKDFDVVHMYEYRSYQNAVVYHYATKHKIPYVLQAHGSVLRMQTKQKFKKIFDNALGYRLLNSASKNIALNQAEYNQYQEMKVSKEKIAIVPNGIDFSIYNPLPFRGEFKYKFGIAADNKVILYLGRINREKGVGLLNRSIRPFS